MGKIILTGIIGLLVIYMGVMIAFKKRIDLINGYHYKHVSEKDRPLFCLIEGSGNIVTGLGFILVGILSEKIGHSGYVIGLIVLFGGIVISAAAIIKYNTVNQEKKRFRH